ncbi:hypothetical protein ABEB36_000034 [Hypothenemus hampei]|uniref:Uncharacterized protein n=1 Tax=Hypothenemus hampei TaxID=57062 RepID=A0ABD1FA16_HYPHA
MCEISRSSPWGVVRQRHAIEVLHPPSVEPFPKSGFLQVKLGERVQISCQANGVPYPLITWLSKGEELKLINRELLSFTASNRTLAGIYECIASNGVGEPARSQIELNIIYPPEVTSDKFWIHTGPGLRAQLECVVSANPQAQVTWLKGKVEVPLDNRIFTLIDGERHLLLIRKVQRSDFGIYTCQVRNELGENRINIQLSGVPNPGIFKKTIDDDISNKNTYTLIWEVDSYTPIIEYSLWFRPYRTGGNLVRTDWTKLTIPAEHRSGPVYSKSYTLRELKEKTVYEAVLISRNRFGWSKPSSVFRFATVGAEVSKDMFTTIQIGLPNDENNAIPLNHISSKGNAVLPIVNFSTLFLVNCYVIYV